jgi:cobalt/nickel transport system permease protein
MGPRADQSASEKLAATFEEKAMSAGPWPWAVHLSDGVLAAPWLLGGFLLLGLLLLPASWRLRDEEIPRVALLTAAFFVASLLHVKVGPTSVHLLLNGLVGVLLGWRAALAILIGLVLQAALIGHGGFTTLGVNACVLTLPALLTAFLFAAVHRLPWLGRPWFRSGLVAAGVLAWLLSLVFGVALLLTAPLGELVHPNRGPGFNVNLTLALAGPAVAATLHPLTLLLAGLVAVVAALAERRLGNPAEFALGLLLGIVAVVTTAALNALVLLLGGSESWGNLVTFVFLAHLPLALIEGVVLGFTVAFLARVKPELLGALPRPSVNGAGGGVSRRTDCQSVPRTEVTGSVLPLALAALFLTAAPARAHRLEGEYKVLPDGRVQIESWFETGDSPRQATVRVYRPDGGLLVEGKLDEESGKFTFRPEHAGPLRVVIDAPGGHRKELTIGADRLGPPPAGPPGPEPLATPSVPPADAVSMRDVIAGLAFVLALGAFVLVVRQQQTIAALKRQVAALRADTAPLPEEPHPGGEGIRASGRSR